MSDGVQDLVAELAIHFCGEASLHGPLLIQIKIHTPPAFLFISGWSRRNVPQKSREMGVTIETIVVGDKKTFPKKGDRVTMHYVGTLVDGTIFDSSRDRGFPFQIEIGVGKVIRGWDEGVLQLSLGQKAILTVTSDFAYGVRGFAPLIAPNSTLKFEVELMRIN